MSVVPILETERLRLRGHTLSDFEALAAMWADPVVVRHISGKPSTREECWNRLIRYAGLWPLLGYGYWVIEEKASGRFAGDGGFADFKREIDPPIDAPEQGWALAPWAHGRGFASEAVAAMIVWAETHFRRRDFMCIISPDNAASIRVAEKVGYREITRTTFKGEPTIMFRRPV